ncbi:MAG: diacylglycerol kinase family protein [Clostridiales bacterium]|nr:diacylglycerol kinase family protein [Clostridiales bacterium]
MKALAKSFIYAWQGFRYCIKYERNMRIHFVIMVYMYSFLFAYDFFELTRVEISIIFIANTIVFMGELINTAVESTINLVEKRYNKFAKIAKDTAAAAVLVGAVFSVAVGIALLWQPAAFRALFEYYKNNILMLVALIVSIVLSCVFILAEPKSEKKHITKTKGEK